MWTPDWNVMPGLQGGTSNICESGQVFLIIHSSLASNRTSFSKALLALFVEGNSCEEIIDSASADWTEFSRYVACHMKQRPRALSSSGRITLPLPSMEN